MEAPWKQGAFCFYAIMNLSFNPLAIMHSLRFNFTDMNLDKPQYNTPEAQEAFVAAGKRLADAKEDEVAASLDTYVKNKERSQISNPLLYATDMLSDEQYQSRVAKGFFTGPDEMISLNEFESSKIENYKLNLTGINLEEDFQKFSEDDWLRYETQTIHLKVLQSEEGLVTLEFSEEKGYLTVSIDSELKKIVE